MINDIKSLKLRGCLIIIGIGLMGIGGLVVYNRSPGTENFLNTGFDLKNIAILSCICGYALTTIFTTRLRVLPVCSLVTLCLAMFIGSFGCGSMGSWGWVVNLIAIMIIAPLAAILCIISGVVSVVTITRKYKNAKKPIFLTVVAVVAVYIILWVLINTVPGLNAAVSLLHSEDKYERIVAAKTLADNRDKRAIDPLIEMLSDTDAKIRALAAQILGSFILAGMNSDTRSIKPLIKALKDDNANVRASAALSLGHITEHLNSEAARWPVEPLKAALKDDDPAVRAAAQNALAMIE